MARMLMSKKAVDEAALTLQLLDEIIGRTAAEQVGVRLWDGTPWPDRESRSAWLTLQHPGALRQMFLAGTEVGMAEAYLYNDYNVEGEIELIYNLVEAVTRHSGSLSKRLHLARELLRLPDSPTRHYGSRGPAHLNGMPHTIERDRQAIAYHYDVSNEFYQLFLDPRMVYSCAYFENASDSLESAQAKKLELVCRKLRLQPGQRVLDIGCGWGGLVIFAAEHYGVQITGITLSKKQYELACQRVKTAGLEGKVEILLRDYREMPADESFDALVSIGMFEHVGEALLPDYFEKAYQMLKPGGVFLNHGIGRCYSDGPEDENSFNNVYVFPDGEMTPISNVLEAAEDIGFEVRDVENMREQYLLTLRSWYKALQAHHKEALQYVDEPTYRVWHMFMSGSAHGFDHGRLKVYQSLLSKPDKQGRSRLPLTRADWYAPFSGAA